MPTKLDWYLQVNLKARQLQLLVALDDFGNLKKVAEVSHVTLPAVSKALTELEKGLGLELFTRTAQGMRPTVYGECLIRYARGMLTDLQQVRDELKALESGSSGKINIGVYPLSSPALVPRALVLLKQHSRSTNVRVIEGPTRALLPQLLEGKLDLVIGRLPALPSSTGFEARELLEEDLLVVTGPQHPLARREQVQWSELAGYTWVLPPLFSQMREPLERVLLQHGVPLENDYLETPSISLSKAYLYLTDAVAVMASTAAYDSSQPLAVLPVSLPRLLRPLGVQWNPNRPLSPAAKLMVECLEEAAATLR